MYNLTRGIITKALTFDDILLVPQFFPLKSRSEVDLSTEIAGLKLTLPIISANMDTVTEHQMAQCMWQAGGLGILHRYMTFERMLDEVRILSFENEDVCSIPAIPSIGIQDGEFEKALAYVDEGAKAVCVDVAHGHTKAVGDLVAKLRYAGIQVIAGNVATYDGALFLASNGANVIKVGVGPGAMCTTRVVTGHGVPQLAAISNAAKIKTKFPKVKIIADGGIKNSGDVVKALAFGADAVMVGSLLSATNHTPGQIVLQNGAEYKEYRGMASKKAQMSFRGNVGNGAPEGVSVLKKYKGRTEDILKELAGGIRSGFSYSGAGNLVSLQNKALYVEVTHAGYEESQPHGI